MKITSSGYFCIKRAFCIVPGPAILAALAFQLDADFTVIMVKRTEGRFRFRDMYLRSETYTRPYTDKLDNLQRTSGRLSNGIVYANFSRPVDSGDSEDKSFRGCVTFQFPVKGGRISRGRMQMHTRTPQRETGHCNILTNCVGSSSFSNTPLGAGVSTNKITNKQTTGINAPVSNDGKLNVVRPLGPPVIHPVVEQNGQAQQPGHHGVQPFLPPERYGGQFPVTKPLEERLGNPVKTGDAPPSCQFSAPGYSVSWLYNEATQNVEFSLSVGLKPGNFWTGIGFGKEMVCFTPTGLRIRRTVMLPVSGPW